MGMPAVIAWLACELAYPETAQERLRTLDLQLFAKYHLTNRYPIPASVRRCSGLEASRSTFLRRLAMCTRT